MTDIQIIYGPPGTGKTHSLLEIVEKELTDGVPLNRIAYVSFTKKATTEVQERVCKKFEIDIKQAPHFRTIHSMAFRSTGAQVGQMMSPDKYIDFGKKSGFNLRGYYNVDEGFTSQDDDFILMEQLYRNNPSKCDRFLDEIDYHRFVTFMSLYDKYKRTFNYLDFTDLLNLYLEKQITQDVDVAIIDEAQDLTSLQWKVVMNAFRNTKRVYIAGDDDQAIYGFAGADTAIFTKLRGSPRVLEKSYRLPQDLVTRATKITKRIDHRVEKTYYGRKERGFTSTLSILEELNIVPQKSYYLLARNNFLLKNYIAYCVDNELWFSVKGVPYITESEVNAYKLHGLDAIDTEKQEYFKAVQHKMIDTPLINIGTIHSVKGGEADIVVLMSDVSRGVFRQMEIDEDDEHRCFYVGYTRAKEHVEIIEPQTRYNYEI